MKTRLFLSLFLLCAALVPGGAAADPRDERNLHPFAILADLVLLRPFGLALTVGGAGVFIATTPFAGIASIAPPHDALQKSSEMLVLAPAAFTFMRPLGDFSYQMGGVYSR